MTGVGRVLASLALAASGTAALAQQAEPPPYRCSGCEPGGEIAPGWRDYFQVLAGEVHSLLNGADPVAGQLRAAWLAAQPAGTPPPPLALILVADGSGQITLARPADGDRQVLAPAIRSALLGRRVTPPPGPMRPVRIALTLGAR